MNLEHSQNNDKGYHPLFIVIVILLFHIIIFSKNHDMVLNQITLRDFDGYWHLARAKDLYNFGNTDHTILSRSNAPYGESLHWTSSFDLILYAGAYIESFFVDFNVALLWWSIILNPLLHALTFLVLFWGLHDFFGDLRASIFGILFPFQIGLLGIFDMGVPDHHGVQLFLFSLFIAFIFKSIFNENGKWFLFCGIVGGISLWFGLESITIVLIAISFFGTVWIIDGKKYEIKNLIFSLTLLLTTSMVLYFDTKNDELMSIVYDRISIVHIFLFAIIASFWIFTTLLSKWSTVFENKRSRTIAAIIGAIVCVLIMRELFPRFFANPLSEVNTTIKLIYLNQTDEFTGLFSKNGTQSMISYIYWGMTLPAVPIGIFLAWRNQGKARKVWLFIVFINIFYIAFSAAIFRMTIYARLCALIPISYMVAHLFISMNHRFIRSYYRIARTIFILACCFSFLVPPMLVKANLSDYLLHDNKFLAQMCQYLNDDPFFEKKPQRILTSIYLGPLLLYKTKHEIIGTPSHRNVSGILDTYHVMNSQKAEDAHRIIRQRGVQILLIGRTDYGIGDYFDMKKNSKKSAEIFHHQLWKGLIPAWLQPYPVPKSLEGKVKIFKVTG